MIIPFIVLFIFFIAIVGRSLYLDSQVAQLNQKLSEANQSIHDLKTKAVEAPKPVCQCKHGYSVHTEDGGCQERLSKTVDGVVTKQSFFCSCRVYTGPIPLPAFYAPDLPELTSGKD